GLTYAYWVVAFKGATPQGVSYARAYVAGSTPASANANAPVYTAASPTATTATVQWSAAGGTAAADGYEVLRQGPGGWQVVSGTLPPGTTSFTDTGLLPGKYYGYWVYGLNGGTKTYAGSYITVITSIPAPPRPVSAAGVPGGVHLTWADLSSEEDSFEVRRYTAGAWAVVGTAGPGVTSFTDTAGLVPGTTYAYWLTSRLGDVVSYAPAYIAATAY
ncbi:MAG: fibronectin type III domain-containing protein, partial [Gemmataceae bacterium]|nr:fibronectin type III domain-containing protein [Gemmataceae bacterium]